MEPEAAARAATAAGTTATGIVQLEQQAIFSAGAAASHKVPRSQPRAGPRLRSPRRVLTVRASLPRTALDVVSCSAGRVKEALAAHEPPTAKVRRTRQSQDVQSARGAAAAGQPHLLYPELAGCTVEAWQLLADLYEAAEEEDVVRVLRLRKLMACPGGQSGWAAGLQHTETGRPSCLCLAGLRCVAD